MPDISMCFNSKNCPLAVDCYRAEESGTRPSEYRQAYSDFRWHENDAGVPHCDNFWRNPYESGSEGETND